MSIGFVDIDNSERLSYKLLFCAFCCTALAEILNVTFQFTSFSLSTYISLFAILLGTACIIRLSYFSEYDYLDYRQGLNLLLIWNIVTIIRGCINAENYWDWKVLLFTNLPAFLIPLTANLGNKVIPIMRLFHFIFPLYFLFTVLLLFPINTSLIVYLWTPIYFLILCFPYMKRKQKLLLLSFIAMLVFADFSARSNIIRVFIALSIALSWQFISLHSRLISMIQRILFLLPFVFLTLGVTHVFNIFDTQSYIKEDIEVTNTAIGTSENALSDTRTGIYKELLTSMNKHKSFLLGEGGCGKYESTLFANKFIGAYRYVSEVGVLNTLLYSGIIGVILYGFIFYKASRLAICKSNNVLAKLIGLFIIFRWDYFFVEEFTNFNTNFFGLWLMIGMGLSPTFRAMTDEDLGILIQYKDIELNT